ncbi:hypothetical protein DH2020_010482 [Rehmannia glutinosa]|uniref:FAD/NAD(P)-binding domain-containing protein n=1 Tax=Rehmannia glutinosa TaxID=99300 RepID=A0ABR0XAR0_REHGL
MEGLLGEKKRVVVVGGGAAGSLIAKTLQDHADVFLIDFKDDTGKHTLGNIDQIMGYTDEIGSKQRNLRGKANLGSTDMNVLAVFSMLNGFKEDYMAFQRIRVSSRIWKLSDIKICIHVKDDSLLAHPNCFSFIHSYYAIFQRLLSSNSMDSDWEVYHKFGIRKEFYEIPWTNLRSMVEPSFAERTVINHSDYLPNAHVITSAATNITQNEVLTAQGRQIAYDYLVIATGHVDSGPYTKAERLSNYEAEHEKIKSAKPILIVGGGPTGVELAAEIIVDFPDKKVTLVHRGSRLLEFIGEKAGKKAMDWLNSKKVEVILGQSVKLSSVSDGAYETSGGETIIADCHFLCTGNPIGSSWLKDTLLKDNLDMHGRLMVDANLRVRGHNNIFAIGDITDIPEIKQGYLAQAHALVAAKNLKLLIKGENDSKLSTYKPASPMALVSLGRREGVAQVMCVTMGGRVPGMIKSGDLFVGKTRKQLGLKSQ